jgi:arylsulfatase
VSRRPNILFLISDQQRPDSMGCYGSPLLATPNLDRLAREGVVFDNCYVQNPLCCPSRYSVLTGRYPHAHRVRSNWYAPREGEVSFGHRLGRAGYGTAMIGKMHLTPWQDTFGFDGRIIAEAKFHTDCPDDYQSFLLGHGWDRRRLYDTASREYLEHCTAVPSKVGADLHIDSFVGRSVCEYLRRAEGPFCLFASFLSPHNPFDPPAPYDTMFLDASFPPRNMAEGEVTRKPREAYEYINRRLKWPYSTDRIPTDVLQRMNAYYHGTCTLIDDWIGRIVEVLKERGQYEDTVLVYSTDHGELMGDHGLVFKQAFYEQSVRVPLIVHSPSRFAPRRIGDLAEWIDLFPTFCELGCTDPGPGNQGRSLVPLLEGRPGARGREAAFSGNYFGRMVRHGPHKMVYYPGRPYGELYDLEEDPLEQENLWDRLEGSPVKQRLKDLLLEWAFASQDPLPLPARADHFDQSPLQHLLDRGGTAVAARQPWHLEGFDDLYRGWGFSDPGELR